MKLVWSLTAWNDYLFWQQNEKRKLQRINALIKDCLRNPREGIGNPEPLKHELRGFYSRRIDKEHRLVYTFNENELVIVACRYHY